MFVAINYIHCTDEYRSTMEQLFLTRAHAIDRIQGFLSMDILKPEKEDDAYLIISRWEHEESFKQWMHSPEFLEGHKRAFADIRQATASGKQAPMKSVFRTYTHLAS
jgi:heme-degrading monooxygenase HmoA